jgi:hypothetical protein
VVNFSLEQRAAMEEKQKGGSEMILAAALLRTTLEG